MWGNGIGGWPARRALMTPDRTALVFEGRSTTYAELSRRVNALASRLVAAGVAAGDRVAYLGQNHPAFVDTLFATTLVGAIFVPLNFRLTGPELAYQLTDAAPAVLVHDPAHPAPGATRTIEVDADWPGGGGDAPAAPPVPVDAPAMILYTSGTTGRPKGAVLSHANLIWNTANVLVGVDVSADEVTLVSAPLFHIAALAQTLLPTLAKGGCAVLTPGFDPDHCLDLVERFRVTWMFGVATMYATLAASPRWASADLSSLRELMCGGAPVPESLIRTYLDRGLVLSQGYGMTETAPGVTYLEASRTATHIGSAGLPVFFTDVRLSDLGELEVSGPNVTPGYWNAPDATAAAFTPDGWFRTGDLARVDDAGHHHIVGRVKDMYISGGENVYPAEVENALTGHPDVAEAAVIGVPDTKWGETGHAFVVGAAAAPEADALRAYLRERLAGYKVPTRFTFVTSLPRTASGKVHKPTLRTEVRRDR
ncbi:long-chain fatty acid--CoA ligase [Actinokineospora auranticolor]|uniref:Fatty-acyl-CoA synthase n=1 Tax=Actinokineospora auranticolor TaxID=155976 RepID=A0A2S6H1Q9_9PSEU|nr:long-chain fatty acid--CoA ligase [Actinokineospora auranticolor]PPK71394.1 fatty-acyl-CoA synthase [Actinokineospora auranticolor]